MWKWLSTYYLFLKGLVLWARSPCWEGEGVGLSSSKVFLLDTVGTVFFGLQSNARFLNLFYLHGTSSFRSTDPISSLLDIYCVFYCLPRQNTKLSIVSLLESEYGDLLAFVCAYLALLFFFFVFVCWLIRFGVSQNMWVIASHLLTWCLRNCWCNIYWKGKLKIETMYIISWCRKVKASDVGFTENNRTDQNSLIIR